MKSKRNFLRSALRFDYRFAVLFSLLSVAGGIYVVSSGMAATDKPPGSLKVISYVYANGGITPYGGVALHVAADSHTTEDVDHNCRDYNQTTGGDGQAIFHQCWVGASGTHDYQLNYINPPAGYSVRSIHGATVKANNGFTVSTGATTNVEVWLDPPAAPPPTPDPTPDPPADKKPGTLQVTTYDYNNGSPKKMGGAEVHIQSVGHETTDTAHNCSVYDKTTNRDTDSTGFGQAHFEECWVGSDGSHDYDFSMITPPTGYSFRSIHGDTTKGDQKTSAFAINTNAESAVAIWFDPPATPPAPTDPGTPTTGADKTPGNIQLNTYSVASGGALTALGGVEVHLQSVGHDTDDTAHNCSDHNQTTSSGGETNFHSCWVGADGTHEYQLSYIKAPAGYTVRGLHGNLVHTANNADTFTVNTNDKTSIALWLNPPPTATTGTGSGTSGGSSATKTPTTKTPSTDSGSTSGGGSSSGGGSGSGSGSGGGSGNGGDDDSADDGAALGTDLDAASAGDPDGAAGDLDTFPPDAVLDDSDGPVPPATDTQPPAQVTTVDNTPPSLPDSVTATEVSPGVIELKWSASNGGHPASAYIIERTQNSTDWSILSSNSSATTYTDTTADFNQTYRYRVSAIDTSAQGSNYSYAQVTTAAFVANVYEDSDEDVEISSDDDIMTLDLPADEFEEDASCGIASLDAEQADDGIPSDYETDGDAYQVICKSADGDTLEDFDEPFDITMALDDDEFKDDSSEIYDISTSETVSTVDAKGATRNAQGKTIVRAKLKSGNTLVLMKLHKQGTDPVVWIGGLGLLAALGWFSLFVNRHIGRLIPHGAATATTEQPAAMTTYLPKHDTPAAPLPGHVITPTSAKPPESSSGPPGSKGS